MNRMKLFVGSIGAGYAVSIPVALKICGEEGLIKEGSLPKVARNVALISLLSLPAVVYACVHAAVGATWDALRS